MDIRSPSGQNQPPEQSTTPQNLTTDEPSTFRTPPQSYANDEVRLHPKKERFGRYSDLVNIAFLAISVFLMVVVVNQFIFQPYEVFGRSMTPTLQEQDRLIISKLGKTWSLVKRTDYIPNRGTIIVFKSTRDHNTQLIKRVIGLPGDRVVVSSGSITVYNDDNPEGFNPDAPYQSNIASYTTGSKDVTVGEHELFVSGDNRTPGGSLDSRNELGLVPVDNLIGELVLRVLPIDSAQAF